MNIIDPRRKRLGTYIAELRRARGLSRPKLIARLAQLLNDDDTLWDVLSEIWLKHIEQGTRVDISRHMLDTLCSALNCTAIEHVHVLWYADRNITVGENAEPSVADVMLNMVMARLHSEAQAILNSLVDQKPANHLTEREMLAIVARTILIVLDELDVLADAKTPP